MRVVNAGSPSTTARSPASAPRPWLVLRALAAAVALITAGVSWGCGPDKPVESNMDQPNPVADDTPAITLELSIVGTPRALSDLRLRARYVATRPVVIFHRLISDPFPDELKLTFTDTKGRATVVDRLVLSLPIANRVIAADFVEVTPEIPLAFEFPVWGLSELAPGTYTIVAEHVGGIGTYLTDDGTKVDAGAITTPIVSNPVQFEHLP